MLGGRAAFLAEIAKSQSSVEHEEKQKFLHVRERMMAKASKLEDGLRRKHEDIFSKLKFEREKMISELQTAWRQKASEEELHSFEEAAMTYKAAQKKLFNVYDEHEKSLKADLEKTRKQTVDMEMQTSMTRKGKKPAISKSQKRKVSRKRADSKSNLDDTDESEMSSSSIEDESSFMGDTPESALPIKDHELPTSGSESDLSGDDFMSKTQRQAEALIKRHERKSPENSNSGSN